MGRIIVSEYVSIDGVIQAPGGGEDYEHGGWTFEFDRPAWPTMEGELADKFNAMRVVGDGIVSLTYQRTD